MNIDIPDHWKQLELHDPVLNKTFVVYYNSLYPKAKDLAERYLTRDSEGERRRIMRTPPNPYDHRYS